MGLEWETSSVPDSAVITEYSIRYNSTTSMNQELTNPPLVEFVNNTQFLGDSSMIMLVIFGIVTMMIFRLTGLPNFSMPRMFTRNKVIKTKNSLPFYKSLMIKLGLATLKEKK